MFKGFVASDGNVNIVPSLGSIDPETALIIGSDSSDERLRAALDAAAQMLALTDKDLSTIPAHANTSGAEYVYIYLRDPATPSFKNGFYVGKGVEDRWLAHVRERIGANARLATKPKHVPIDNWVKDQTAGASPRELMARAANHLVRKVGAWTGPHAAVAAFAAEYALISVRIGVWSLTNDTSGNHRFGELRMVGRPAGLGMHCNHNLTLWRRTVAEFDQNPEEPLLNSRLKPAMILLGNFSTIERISERVARLGLTPLKARARANEDLIGHIPEHYDIDGASDATVNFQACHLPIRVSLKLSFQKPAVRVNLRPIPGMPDRNTAFLSALGDASSSGKGIGKFYDGRLPIRRPNDPYFKPFAVDGNGNRDVPFPIDGSCVLVDTNWLASPKMLSLYDALGLLVEKLK